MSQISHLDKQVYLSGNGLLRAAYHDATTTRAHGYMVIDFHQAISEKFRLRSTLYSDEDFPKAQPKVVKQLEAGADKDLINPLLECTANIPNGNMILQPHQKQPLSRHGDALQALSTQWVLLWSLTDGRQLRGPDASLA